MNRIFILTPLIVLLIICIFSLVYLLSGKDPNKPPSALLNKDVPIFESSSLYNAKDVIKTIDIKNKKTLINFFASWCSPCKIEHPLFFEIQKKYPELYLLGFNHKDQTLDAKKYLEDQLIEYELIDITKDSNAAEYVISVNGGKRIIPTFIIDSKIYTNPGIQELSKLIMQ